MWHAEERRLLNSVLIGKPKGKRPLKGPV
jgi:hypothetical protein